jgi:hypothetical protein
LSGSASSTPGAGARSGGAYATYRSSEPSGLNDCENKVLGNGMTNDPDANRDFIPNGLEARAYVPFQGGTQRAQDTPYSDGMRLYDKIKQSVPTLIPYNQILNPKPSHYDLALLPSSSASQDCFSVTVTDLPIVGPQDEIRVDIILTSNLLQDRFLYRTARKRFAPGAPALLINDWTDPAETAAGTWKRWP